MDNELKLATPKSAYSGARYILDCGRDLLLQQKRKVDAGELGDVRRHFQVIFHDINDKYVGFFVHKAFIPYLGEVIGELIKIRFPKIKGTDEPIEWMARVVVVGERNINNWRDRGFSEDASDEVGITLEFADLPLNRKETVDKVLQWKWRQIKKERRMNFWSYLFFTLRSLFVRFFKYAVLSLALILGAAYFLADSVDEYAKSMLRLQKKVVDRVQLKNYQVIKSELEKLQAAEHASKKPIDAGATSTQTELIENLPQKLKELKNAREQQAAALNELMQDEIVGPRKPTSKPVEK